MMFVYPPLFIPEILPHVEAVAYLGTSQQNAREYRMSVSGSGIYTNVNGRGAHSERVEFVQYDLLGALASAESRGLHRSGVLLKWFHPGNDYRGDDASTLQVFKLTLGVLHDWHCQRSRAYDDLYEQLASNADEVRDSSYADEALMEDWGNRLAAIEQILNDERAFCRFFKSLLRVSRVYGIESSLVSEFAAAKANGHPILQRYS